MEGRDSLRVGLVVDEDCVLVAGGEEGLTGQARSGQVVEEVAGGDERDTNDQREQIEELFYSR